jgi:ribosomal protein RSM22 (predicted rRNA methylase)
MFFKKSRKIKTRKIRYHKRKKEREKEKEREEGRKEERKKERKKEINQSINQSPGGFPQYFTLPSEIHATPLDPQQNLMP